jgi:hypothetical protein
MQRKRRIDMKKILIQVLGTAACIAVSMTGTVLAGENQPRAVVELFTSQGCSSCPPADKIMAEYAIDGDVLALSWHVDYWNYLGWKDTFSKAQFTDRQQRYAKTMREGQIYTPQAVVNGREHTVGSRKSRIEDLIRRFDRSGMNLNVAINVTLTDKQMQIRVNEKSATQKHPTLYMVYFNKVQSVKIERGENRGKTIVYRNIVRDAQMLGMLKDGAISLDLPLMEIKRAGYDSCAILLQETTVDGTPGAIIGATVIDDLKI